ncbi:MAG: prepilin-type N-terminal cleavage/methylation domain-containing protein [Armatimonadota bacterium]
MKTMRGKQGFSLVELLTVIAIIAILSAIIFPVMGAVKNRAKQVQCMTNLHDLAIAIKMYQQDNRRYPDSLAGITEYKDGAILPLEHARNGGGLYPEYIKAVKGFHCPLAVTSSTTAAVRVTKADGLTYEYYAYSSYDIYTQGVVNGTAVANYPLDMRYTTRWANTEADVDNYKAASSNPDRTYDYKRQLRFRNPSDDTIVTWCSYHERQGDKKSMVPVLFLDGHADMISAAIVEGSDTTGDPGCRWRTESNK